MARLGGIKVAARKLKKHRKRNILIHSATKILRTSIKSNKNRRTNRSEEKSATPTLPLRVSTRTCVRRNSREGIPEAPLRTVELIKRPLELREPATKLLYLASLGLYPRTGDSDMTPIVVIKELSGSPGKKNGVRKSMELPLIPYYRRFIDLANHDKRSFSENIKPVVKSSRGENRKTPPAVNGVSNKETVSSNGEKKTQTNHLPLPTPILPPLPVTICPTVKVAKKSANKSNQSNSLVKSDLQFNGFNMAQIPSTTCSLPGITVTTTSNSLRNSYPIESEIVSSKPKSLLRNNLSVSSTHQTKAVSQAALNFTTNFVSDLSSSVKQSSNSNANAVKNAMNLIMSNLTIIPKLVNPITVPSRKRSASPKMGSNLNLESNRKPPKKKLKQNHDETNHSRLSVPVSLSSNNYTCQSNMLSQPPMVIEEALNLSVNRRSFEDLAPVQSKVPPKLQSSPTHEQPKSSSGPKPLNLIIPRPPPLTKAPLELANTASCSQNVQPQTKAKSKPRNSRKSRQNVNQSNLMQLQPIIPTSVIPALPAETTVHAKSLLKCMNGEENTCVREVGESLDSVKTMLARLQTRIGPAVNGVRLITIE